MARGHDDFFSSSQHAGNVSLTSRSGTSKASKLGSSRLDSDYTHTSEIAMADHRSPPDDSVLKDVEAGWDPIDRNVNTTIGVSATKGDPTRLEQQQMRATKMNEGIVVQNEIHIDRSRSF